MVFLFAFNVALPRHENARKASATLTGTQGLHPVTGSMSVCVPTGRRPHALARNREVEPGIFPSWGPTVDRQPQGYCNLYPGLLYESRDR